jgi:predicted HTH domain antitoxin
VSKTAPFKKAKVQAIGSFINIDFQKLLADRNICIHYDVEDFEQDVQNLRNRGWL